MPLNNLRFADFDGLKPCVQTVDSLTSGASIHYNRGVRFGPDLDSTACQGYVLSKARSFRLRSASAFGAY